MSDAATKDIEAIEALIQTMKTPLAFAALSAVAYGLRNPDPDPARATRCEVCGSVRLGSELMLACRDGEECMGAMLPRSEEKLT